MIEKHPFRKETGVFLPEKSLLFYCFRIFRLLFALSNSNGHSHSRTDHGVVAHAQEAHHLHVSGDGGRTGKLSVGVHTAHGVGHAVGSGTGGHVVGVQGAARAAAGGRRGGGLDVWKRTRNGQKLSDIWKQFRLQAQ